MVFPSNCTIQLEYGQLKQLLADSTGLLLQDSFGFNNTYALAVNRSVSEEKNLRSISDLRGHPDLKFGLSYEYLERGDGWGAPSGLRRSEGKVG